MAWGLGGHTTVHRVTGSSGERTLRWSRKLRGNSCWLWKHMWLFLGLSGQSYRGTGAFRLESAITEWIYPCPEGEEKAPVPVSRVLIRTCVEGVTAKWDKSKT